MPIRRSTSSAMSQLPTPVPWLVNSRPSTTSTPTPKSRPMDGTGSLRQTRIRGQRRCGRQITPVVARHTRPKTTTRSPARRSTIHTSGNTCRKTTSASAMTASTPRSTRRARLTESTRRSSIRTPITTSSAGPWTARIRLGPSRRWPKLRAKISC